MPKSVTTGKKSKKRLKQNQHQTTLFVGIEHFAADYLSELSKSCRSCFFLLFSTLTQFHVSLQISDEQVLVHFWWRTPMHDTNSWDSYYYSLVRGNQKLLFPADLPIERLMQEHDSKPQNPIIANVLYKSKILKSWGRGIGTMVDECKRVGLPAPEFNTDGNFVWVVFKYNRNSVVVTPQLPHSYPTVTPRLPHS